MLTEAQIRWLDNLSALYEEYGPGLRPVAEVAAPVVARVTRHRPVEPAAVVWLPRWDDPYVRTVGHRSIPATGAG